MNISKIIIVSLVLFAASCGRKSLSPAEYVKWVEASDNGVNAEKEFEDISYQVIYKPVDYILAKELVNHQVNPSELDERKKELGDMQYFTLRIKTLKSEELLKAGITSEAEYYQRLEYFMGPVQNDLYLVEGKDTVPCIISHFERNYGLAPYNNLILAFDKVKNDKADKLFVYDDQLLGTGKVMINIKADDIMDMPSVNWNNK